MSTTIVSRFSNFRFSIFFLFIVMTIYCYGAGMMDYFAMYEGFKMVGDQNFPGFHHVVGERIVAIFVIPSAIMTVLNILTIIFPVRGIPKRYLWWSLVTYAFDWIFSFTMQIPIQLRLADGKNMQLIDELLRTNWLRFAADSCQFLIVCALLWVVLKRSVRI